eukprot:3771614-Heterocapsa_arctica.AAC.1
MSTVMQGRPGHQHVHGIFWVVLVENSRTGMRLFYLHTAPWHFAEQGDCSDQPSPVVSHAEQEPDLVGA